MELFQNTALTPDEYDTPWKEAITRYFPEFMAFYFPDAHAAIDWSRGHRFLDQELAQVVKDAELGKRIVDKLAQVATYEGDEEWVYIHIEIQGGHDSDFAKRLFTYNYRLYDKYDRPVASLALLADDRENWKPQTYGYTLFGSDTGIRFPVVKLLEYQDQTDHLLENPNPFALVTAAHLLTRQTKGNDQARLSAKWRLAKLLYQRNWDKQRIIDLFSVIDWMMYVPPELQKQLWQNIEHLERNCAMPYITSVERIGIEKGIEMGLQQGLQKGLQQGLQQGKYEGEAALLERQMIKRFGAAFHDEIHARLKSATSEQRARWAERILDAASLPEVFGEH